MDRIEALRAALKDIQIVADRQDATRIEDMAYEALDADDRAAAEQDEAQTAEAIEASQFMPDDHADPDCQLCGKPALNGIHLTCENREKMLADLW